MITEECLKAKINALCKDAEELNRMKNSISNGVQQYSDIQTLYVSGKALTEEFSKKFSAFYRIRGILDRKEFFRLIAAKKELPIDSVMLQIANPERRYSHLSFASKALHTINNDLPIYDSHVGAFFDLEKERKMRKQKKASFEQKIQIESEIYEHLLTFFRNCKQNGLSKFADLFDKMYPATGFSEVKKIDFIIWGITKI